MVKSTTKVGELTPFRLYDKRPTLDALKARARALALARRGFPHRTRVNGKLVFPLRQRDARKLSANEITDLANILRFSSKKTWSGLPYQQILDMTWVTEDFGGFYSWDSFAASHPKLAKYLLAVIPHDEDASNCDDDWVLRAEWSFFEAHNAIYEGFSPAGWNDWVLRWAEEDLPDRAPVPEGWLNVFDRKLIWRKK